MWTSLDYSKRMSNVDYFVCKTMAYARAKETLGAVYAIARVSTEKQLFILHDYLLESDINIATFRGAIDSFAHLRRQIIELLLCISY